MAGIGRLTTGSPLSRVAGAAPPRFRLRECYASAAGRRAHDLLFSRFQQTTVCGVLPWGGTRTRGGGLPWGGTRTRGGGLPWGGTGDWGRRVAWGRRPG